MYENMYKDKALMTTNKYISYFRNYNLLFFKRISKEIITY